MTARLQEEMRRLWDFAPPDPEGLVFGITNNFKRSFGTACRLAAAEDFRLHDCRHTATTKMIQAGMAPMEVMKITGHFAASLRNRSRCGRQTGAPRRSDRGGAA